MPGKSYYHQQACPLVRDFSVNPQKHRLWQEQNPGVVTIKYLCDGLGITLIDFFDSELFRELEKETSIAE